MVFAYIRQLVSKRRKRFVTKKYNLDLSYITERIIAMSYPAENLESLFRNPIWQVQDLLSSHHPGHYKVYNLCSEAQYSPHFFEGRIEHLPVDDHHTPPLRLVKAFCESVHTWLAEDPENVAVVHCRAGKGRTGIMVCCYLVLTGMSAQQALDFYSEKRTTNQQGVTIASQRRYVGYWASLVHPGVERPQEVSLPEPVKLTLRRLRIYDMSGEALDFSVFQLEERSGEIYSPRQEVGRGRVLPPRKGAYPKMLSIKYFLPRSPVNHKAGSDSEEEDEEGDLGNGTGNGNTLALIGANRSRAASMDKPPRSPTKWIAQMETERVFDQRRPHLECQFEKPLVVCGDVSIAFREKNGKSFFYSNFNTAFISNRIFTIRKHEMDRLNTGSWAAAKMGPDFSLELIFGMGDLGSILPLSPASSTLAPSSAISADGGHTGSGPGPLGVPTFKGMPRRVTANGFYLLDGTDSDTSGPLPAP
eukprot:TRINITY_DN29703_c0_g1_i1.p1 TRINITY_DN29703_c0_g1~~TRINITY_DN29703_c0_g1_i1.p1  ORF type:complete len:474 (+),score=75.12 TRINITY_DN29703_c0_g1_i1:168-1589(+)